jgi:hypothetical protein
LFFAFGDKMHVFQNSVFLKLYLGAVNLHRKYKYMYTEILPPSSILFLRDILKKKTRCNAKLQNLGIICVVMISYLERTRLLSCPYIPADCLYHPEINIFMYVCGEGCYNIIFQHLCVTFIHVFYGDITIGPNMHASEIGRVTGR